MFKKHSRNKHYWFTIQSPNGQTLATSETYTTAAMRDKGIEAVKKVVNEINLNHHLRDLGYKRDGNGWKPADTFQPTMKVPKDLLKDIDRIGTVVGKPRRPSDTFHIENKKGKIVKR